MELAKAVDSSRELSDFAGIAPGTLARDLVYATEFVEDTPSTLVTPLP